MATQTKSDKAAAGQTAQDSSSATVGTAAGASESTPAKSAQGESQMPDLQRLAGAEDLHFSSAQVLRVIAKRDGFRRAGREWHGTTDVLLTDLSEAQVKQLQNEPALATMLLDMPVEQAFDLVDR